MFESFDDERTRWISVQQRGRNRFFLQNIAGFSPLTFILLGKLLQHVFPAANRAVLVAAVLGISLLLVFAMVTLMWRRGLRLTQQA
jgi:hypothetical protein